jgi:hypothetical protein
METEDQLEENYFLIQDSENEEIVACINRDTYNQKVREVQRERYAPKVKEASKLEMAGANYRYNIYLVSNSKRVPIVRLSEDMIEKGFPKIFEYFKGMNLLN